VRRETQGRDRQVSLKIGVERGCGGGGSNGHDSQVSVKIGVERVGTIAMLNRRTSEFQMHINFINISSGQIIVQNAIIVHALSYTL
jgi:hypothetical protein